MMTMTTSQTNPPSNTNPWFDPSRMKGLGATQIGRVGEYFVASILGGYGHDVIPACMDGYDLLVFFQGVPIRVDVKTATASDRPMFNVGKGKTTTFRAFSNDNVDLFAFLRLDTLQLVFRPSYLYVGKRTVRLPVKDWDVDPYDSWQESTARFRQA